MTAFAGGSNRQHTGTFAFQPWGTYASQPRGIPAWPKPCTLAPPNWDSIAARTGASCGPMGDLRITSCWFRMPVDSGMPGQAKERNRQIRRRMSACN